VQVRVSGRTSFALICLVVVGTISCGDYSVQLPGGYSLVRVYGQTVLISHFAEGVVIGASIDGYAVVGSLIVGHTKLADQPPESEYSKPGYFIIDTQTHDSKQGLDKTNWLKSLKAAGISVEPNLHRPSRFDKEY
jgi:hypothetical protein